MNNNKIKSPEQLNNYIRVTSPGIWFILSAIMLFLAGFFVWIFAGELEISFPTYVYTDGNNSLAFMTADKALQLKKGMNVRVMNTESKGVIQDISSKAVSYEDIASKIGDDNTELMGIRENSKMFQVSMNLDNAPQNISRAVIVTDAVKPSSFLLK